MAIPQHKIKKFNVWEKKENLWNAAESVFRGKFTAINAYIKKEERSQVNNQTLYIEELEKK